MSTLPVQQSELELLLTRNGCRFTGQERLSNHEPDIDKPCQCGRPNKRQFPKDYRNGPRYAS